MAGFPCYAVMRSREAQTRFALLPCASIRGACRSPPRPVEVAWRGAGRHAGGQSGAKSDN
jgi:hypothetical protein